eukprot:101406-Chlamydomonas_euryale.AAC.15
MERMGTGASATLGWPANGSSCLSAQRHFQRRRWRTCVPVTRPPGHARVHCAAAAAGGSRRGRGRPASVAWN